MSDLHGDGRVHEITEADEMSGFGFELTMRIKCEGEEVAPLWPAQLMQGLARYVFKSGNLLYHITIQFISLHYEYFY